MLSQSRFKLLYWVNHLGDVQLLISCSMQKYGCTQVMGGCGDGHFDSLRNLAIYITHNMAALCFLDYISDFIFMLNSLSIR